MSGKSRRPAPAGHTKTDLRRGHLTPTRAARQPAAAPRAPVATTDDEQAFLFGAPEPSEPPRKA